MGENVYGQNHPVWEFKNEGKEIHQNINSAPGIAIGNAKLSSVDFEGTMFVANNWDYDYIGVIFSYQVFKSLPYCNFIIFQKYKIAVVIKVTD